MHQTHNIPWSLIESNFKFVHEHRRYTPPRSTLFFQDRPTGPKELKHLVMKLVTTIEIFSETERKKYPAHIEPMMTGNVFSDELLQKYPAYLKRRYQPIENWINRFQTYPEEWRDHGDLINVVNVLLAENEMEMLLMLAQHPQIHMERLHYHSWGHHFGFCRAKEAALASYIFFNSAEAAGALANGDYTQDSAYPHLINEITHPMDYDGQQVPHIAFFRDAGVLHKPAREAIVHNDYERVQQYMKDLFAILYRYDVLAKECGVEFEWWKEIVNCYPLGGVVKVVWDDAVGDNVLL